MHRIFMVMAVLISAFPVGAKLLYVTPDGSNSNDGSSERPWATIAKAVGSTSTAAAGVLCCNKVARRKHRQEINGILIADGVKDRQEGIAAVR